MAFSAFRVITSILVAGPSLTGLSFGAWMYLTPPTETETQALGSLATASPEMQAMALQQLRMAKALDVVGEVTGYDLLGPQEQNTSSNIITASKPQQGLFEGMMQQVSGSMTSFGYDSDVYEPVASRPGPGAKFVSVSND